MSDIEVQKLMDDASDLQVEDKYFDSIGKYLEALKIVKKDWGHGTEDVDWQKKAISMACNGMGIAYAKLGNISDAIENFSDAVEYAPNEEARDVVLRNLRRYQQAVADKTNNWPASPFDDK